MTTVTSSAELARLLLDKAKAAGNGKDFTGAETLCRCTETFIKLARLELEISGKPPNGAKQLTVTASWVGLNPVNLLGDGPGDDAINAAIKAAEIYLSEVEDKIENVKMVSPRHVAAKILLAEAAYLRAYLLGLRDCLS